MIFFVLDAKEKFVKPERAFERQIPKGWRTLKRSWPDYLLLGPDGERQAVEIKGRRKSGRLARLTADQADTMELLEDLGVQCFVSDGEVQERYDRQKHA